MNSQHNADSLAESALSLESLQDDTFESLRAGELNSREVSMLDTQLSIATEAFDKTQLAVDAAKTAWSFVKKTVNAAHVRFAHVVEDMRVRFDKTGVQEIKRLHRLVAEAQGDGGGVMHNQRLANRLQIRGDVPKDFGQPATELMQLSSHFVKDVLPKLSHLNKEAAGIFVSSEKHKPEEFSEDLSRLMKVIHAYGAPTSHFQAKDLKAVYPGGRHVFFPVKVTPSRGHTEVQDPESLAIRKAVEEATVGVDRKGYNVHDKAYLDKIPVLSREELHEMLRLCELLSDSMRRLLGAAEVYRLDPPPQALSLYIELAMREMKQGVQRIHNGSVEHSTVEVTSEDRARARWVADYFRLSLNDHLAILETLYNVTHGVFESYVDYVRACLAQYK